VATERRCESEREDRSTKLEDKRDGVEEKSGAFFSTVTRTAFYKTDSDLEPCVLALRRAEDDEVEASLDEEGSELEILEDGEVNSGGGA
jgi:hypothetical protein